MTVGIDGYQVVTCPDAQNPGSGLVTLEGVPTDPNGQYLEFFADFGPAAGVLPVITPATPGHGPPYPFTPRR